MGCIVVGVDGSKGSLAALQWAIEEAAFRKAKVVAVQAWLPYSQVSPLESMAPVFQAGEGEAIAKELLARSVAKVAEGGHGEVVVEQQVFCDHPVSALLDASKGADLLVVGSRGHGGFLGLVLGSVSNQCIHHATCPVVVIRERDEDKR